MKSRGRKLPFSPAEIYSLVSVIPSANSTGQQRTGHDSADDAQADSHAETNQSPLAAGLGLDGRTVLPRQEQNQADQRDKEAQNVQASRRLVHLDILARHGAATGGADDSVIIDFFSTVVAVFHIVLSFRGGLLPCFYFFAKTGAQAQGLRP